MMTMMAAQKAPLLLKDYLELDPFSETTSSPTTVRFLLESDPGLTRSRSKRAFTRISAVFNAVKNFPLPSPASRPFWLKRRKNHKQDECCHKVTVKDIVRLNSFELYGHFPSPTVSSCSSCSDADDRSESFPSSSSASSEFLGNVIKTPPNKSPVQSPRQNKQYSSSHSERTTTTQSLGTECTECQCQSEEAEAQLSPVLVMDFPYREDEEDYNGEGENVTDTITSLGFEQSFANIERTTHQLLQNIRRFEALGGLDPHGLQLSFSASDDQEEVHVASPEETAAEDLIQRLRIDFDLAAHDETLLTDFFVEGLSCSAGTKGAACEEELLSAAGEWIDGRCCLWPELSDMERNNGRWRCFDEGKEDVAANVETRVLRSLVHELVLELIKVD